MLRIALCLLAVLGTATAVDDGAELVAEFRRYYGKDRSPEERREAVLVLQGIDSRMAAEALLEAFEDEDFAVRRAAVETLGTHRLPATATWLVEEVLTDRKVAKRTLFRAGVAESLGRMQQPVAFETLRALLGERDLSLRLAGITALGFLGEARGCAEVGPLVRDADGAVAVAALEALIRIGDGPASGASVVTGLEHPDWRVRARAIEAVVALSVKAGVRPIIELMATEEGRLRGDAYVALKSMTLRDFGEDAATWRTWWDRTEPSYELPDPKLVAEALERARTEGTKYTAGQKEFLGLQTTSENILFVIDVSGSMETPFGDPERLAATGRTYKSLQRLEIVKEELSHTIRELPETTSFNIVAFATDVKAWKKDTVKANVLNKNNALAWVARLKPLGSEAQGFKAQTGLIDMQTNEGLTNTHLALMTALGEPLESKGPADFVTNSPKSPLDTIFFLTDGEPTIGKSLDMTVIRREVRRVNEFRGVQLHVIYVGEFGGDDFKVLARENGGVFVAIGG